MAKTTAFVTNKPPTTTCTCGRCGTKKPAAKARSATPVTLTTERLREIEQKHTDKWWNSTNAAERERSRFIAAETRALIEDRERAEGKAAAARVLAWNVEPIIPR